MTETNRTRTGVCMAIACTLTMLTGCSQSADKAKTATDGGRPATAGTAVVMPEQARVIAAQNAQGAEADAKKRASAMAKSAPKSQ
ncbi:MAG: hypothetical protein H7145_22600 [Akkermansiaceae bacterium]|nr:hypothetical protein [Armatimonadota bacterium]